MRLTITSQSYVWTLTNEWFSDGSFLFYRGWGFRNLAEFISLSPQLRSRHLNLNQRAVKTKKYFLSSLQFTLRYPNARFTSHQPPAMLGGSLKTTSAIYVFLRNQFLRFELARNKLVQNIFHPNHWSQCIDKRQPTSVWQIMQSMA